MRERYQAISLPRGNNTRQRTSILSWEILPMSSSQEAVKGRVEAAGRVQLQRYPPPTKHHVLTPLP